MSVPPTESQPRPHEQPLRNRAAAPTNAGSLRDARLLLLGAAFSYVLFFAVNVHKSTILPDVIEDAVLATMGLPLASVPVSSLSSLPGWNPVHVYYGDTSHLDHVLDPRHSRRSVQWLGKGPANGRQWTSQFGQDVAVMKILDFPTGAFFFDLAANGPVWMSNTYVLETHFDWKGICVEPNPIYWYPLSFRSCHVVGAVVGARNMDQVSVLLDPGQMAPSNGIVGDTFDNRNVTQPGLVKPRFTASLTDILEHFQAPAVIDYFSLDVEGAELFIMKNFPFEKYLFLCLTIERAPPELQEILSRNGYKFVYTIRQGVDDLWVHESIYDQAKANLAIRTHEIATKNPQLPVAAA